MIHSASVLCVSSALVALLSLVLDQVNTTAQQFNTSNAYPRYSATIKSISAGYSDGDERFLVMYTWGNFPGSLFYGQVPSNALYNEPTFLSGFNSNLASIWLRNP